MDAELKHLQIDRAAKRPAKSPRWIVPAISRLEALLPVPFGQSLIVVLTRP